MTVACHRKPSTPPDVVARVGDRMLTLSDFKRYIERNSGTDLASITPEVATALLDQYVEEVLLAEYAGAHGVEIPAEKIAAGVRTEPGITVIEKRDEMRRQKLLADVIGDVAEASDDEVRTYYEAHPSDFKNEEEVHARQILVHDEAAANDISAKLKSGASFEELSVQYSVAANAKRGGDIGYISRGKLPKRFEDEIFGLQPGKVSGVVETDNSYYIFKVDDRRPAGTIDLQTAAPVIREKLREEAIRERMAQLVGKAKTDTQIAILTKRLPFPYTGALPKSDNE